MVNGRAMGQGGWTCAGSANCGSSALMMRQSPSLSSGSCSFPSLGPVLDHISWSTLLSSWFSFLFLLRLALSCIQHNTRIHHPHHRNTTSTSKIPSTSPTHARFFIMDGHQKPETCSLCTSIIDVLLSLFLCSCVVHTDREHTFFPHEPTLADP
jgi:hypothetical protein